MPVRYEIVTTTVQSGTVEFTHPGFGTPVGAIFVSSGATTVGESTSADARFSIGFADGTNENVSSMIGEDGVTTGDCFKRATTDELLMLLDGTGAIDGEAAFSAWITDGVAISVGRSFSSAVYVTCILIGGDDTEVYTDINDNTSKDQNVEDVRFESTSVYTHSINDAFDDVTKSTDASIQFGAATWDGTTVNQCSQNWFSDNRSAGNTDVQLYASNVDAMRAVSSGGLGGGWNFSTFDADGFNLDQVSVAGMVGAYIAIRSASPVYEMEINQVIDDVLTEVVYADQTLATTDDTDFVVMMGSRAGAVNTLITDAKASVFNLGFARRDLVLSGEFAQVNHGFAFKDGEGTSIAQSGVDTGSVLKIMNSAGTYGGQALIKVIDSQETELTYRYLQPSNSTSVVLIVTTSAYKPWSHIGDYYLEEAYNADREKGITHTIEFNHTDRATKVKTYHKIDSEALSTNLSGSTRQLLHAESGLVIGSDASDDIVGGPYKAYVPTGGGKLRIVDRSIGSVVFSKDGL